jgi:hypothetical protein
LRVEIGLAHIRQHRRPHVIYRSSSEDLVAHDRVAIHNVGRDKGPFLLRRRLQLGGLASGVFGL